MAKRRDGKVAVISGAAAGIGQASAVRLAEEGAQIVIARPRGCRKDLAADRKGWRQGASHPLSFVHGALSCIVRFVNSVTETRRGA